MAKTIIKAQMKQRIDTEDNWKAKNPVLLNGELGLISGDPRYKIGNGTSPWNDLPFRGVGIEEYDNRTLVQADGLVGTDDVHYFLPNANPTDKKHTFAMLSDIPEGGGSAGGSGALRVWMYQNDMSELTQQQVDDNIATYNAIASGDTTSVLVCVKFEDDSLLSVSTYHATSDYVAYSNGQKFVTVTIYGVDADLLVTAVSIELNADGTITME